MSGYLQHYLVDSADIPERTTWDVTSLREAGEMRMNSEGFCPKIAVQNLSIKAADHNLVLKILTPIGIPADAPLIIAPHGRGYVSGLAQQDDDRIARLALEQNCHIISPEYRRAPENPYPYGRDDCSATIKWALEAQKGSPIFGFGDTAGSRIFWGGLIKHLRDGGEPISGFICLEPFVDPSLNAESMLTDKDGSVWTRQAAFHAWQAYLDDADPKKVFPPIEDLDNIELPPSFFVVNPVDPLSDEGVRFAMDMVEVGAKVEFHMYEGTFRGSLGEPGPVWDELNKDIAKFIAKYS